MQRDEQIIPATFVDWEMVTRWPGFLRIFVQRSAVTRLPYLDCGGAGVTIPIFIGSSLLEPCPSG